MCSGAVGMEGVNGCGVAGVIAHLHLRSVGQRVGSRVVELLRLCPTHCGFRDILGPEVGEGVLSPVSFCDLWRGGNGGVSGVSNKREHTLSGHLLLCLGVA